jgi:hypothetical protein
MDSHTEIFITGGNPAGETRARNRRPEDVTTPAEVRVFPLSAVV